MHEYDIALKSVLMQPASTVLRELTGLAVSRWRNVELPEVRNRRVDLLGETADGRLTHIELQSTNDRDMALRMAEYALAIFRSFRRFPEQLVLYVGEAPLRMNSTLESSSVSVRCRILSLSEMDGEPLLASDHLEDNLIAVLTRLADQRDAVRRILWKIARSGPARREAALSELLILAGLRKLAGVIRQEAEQMPILNDIMDHEVLGPKLRQARETGLQEGRQAGQREGRREGERRVVLRQAEKRFGPIPGWARERLEAMSTSDLERIALRLLDVRDLEELLS